MKKIDRDEFICDIRKNVPEITDFQVNKIFEIIDRQPDYGVSDAAKCLVDEISTNEEFERAISASAFSAIRELKTEVSGQQLADIIVKRIFGLQ